VNVHLNHLVEGRFVAGGARRAVVFRLFDGFERCVRSEHAAARWAQHRPGHFKDAEPRCVQKSRDDAFFVDTVAQGEVEHVDAIEQPVRRLANGVLECCNDVLARLSLPGEVHVQRGDEFGRVATFPSNDCGLDHAVWRSLTGRQRHLGVATARSAAYDRDVSPFAAFASPPAEGDWAELATLVGANREVAFTPNEMFPPNGWVIEEAGHGYQMTGDQLTSTSVGPAAETVHDLGAADVEDIFALLEVARPGPFERRTIAFGDYRGIRSDGMLVAMAGTRMRFDHWTEISALATHPSFRGRGFGEYLLRDVAARIRSRGEKPFLHVAAENPAIRLYQKLGFRIRRETRFTFVRSPAA
jgi:ribosomal protein S18 acetylase RimI-like enzyme